MREDDGVRIPLEEIIRKYGAQDGVDLGEKQQAVRRTPTT
jgi:hypothetical protein